MAATISPMARQPFGEVSSSRLQQLASMKNRQNGITIAADMGKGPAITSPGKRSYGMTILEDDSENVDPSLDASSKKSKSGYACAGNKPSTPLSSSITVKTTSEPRSCITPARAMSPVKNTMTAPAGRSPKRKILGLDRTRRGMKSFTRIDPPFSFGASTALPFSLDAALSSTLGQPAKQTVKAVPSKWKFTIHEDTPDEEAATLMEHSTLTLDLSSDDEAAQSRELDRGKENVAPEGYTTPTRASNRSQVGAGKDAVVEKQAGLRRKLAQDAMDDDRRSPLSELEFVEQVEEVTAEVADEAAAVPTLNTFDFTAKNEISPEQIECPSSPAETIIIFEDHAEPVNDTTAPQTDVVS